ncbi:MAG: 16S rRNA (guanine(527)-N(7))-methyltransferase RsmG [Thermoanaerobaculum sp.]
MRGQEGEFRELLGAAGLDGGVVEGLLIFLGLLGRWGRVCDLTASLPAHDLVRDHVLESLAGVPWVPAGVVVDVGSGAGFPAIPILLARRDVHGVLVEPRARRWAFLKEVVRELGLDAEVRRGRVEGLGLAEVAGATVRGLAREVWEGGVGGLVGGGGRLLWWAGPRAPAGPPAGWKGVVTSPLPNPKRGRLVVWERCST